MERGPRGMDGIGFAFCVGIWGEIEGFFGAEVGQPGGDILLGDCTIGEYQRCRNEAAIVMGIIYSLSVCRCICLCLGG